MKTLFMLLFTVSTIFTGINEIQESETVTATYMGTQDGQYYFASGDEKMAFQAVDSKVAAVVDLSDAALKGQSFTVTYTVEESENEEGEVTEVKTITGIAPAKG